MKYVSPKRGRKYAKMKTDVFENINDSYVRLGIGKNDEKILEVSQDEVGAIGLS